MHDNDFSFVILISSYCVELKKKQVHYHLYLYMLKTIVLDLIFMLCLQVYSILRHVAEVLEYSKDEQLERLYQRTAWVFDEKYKRPGYGAYDAFKQAVS